MCLWASRFTDTVIALLRRAPSLLLASINIGLLTEAASDGGFLIAQLCLSGGDSVLT
jgi:hypothetical protein